MLIITMMPIILWCRENGRNVTGEGGELKTLSLHLCFFPPLRYVSPVAKKSPDSPTSFLPTLIPTMSVFRTFSYCLV